MRKLREVSAIPHRRRRPRVYVDDWVVGHPGGLRLQPDFRQHGFRPRHQRVECDNSEFDAESFAEMVHELVRDYLEAIKLERKSLEVELKVLRGGVE